MPKREVSNHFMSTSGEKKKWLQDSKEKKMIFSEWVRWKLNSEDDIKEVKDSIADIFLLIEELTNLKPVRKSPQRNRDVDSKNWDDYQKQAEEEKKKIKLSRLAHIPGTDWYPPRKPRGTMTDKTDLLKEIREKIAPLREKMDKY